MEQIHPVFTQPYVMQEGMPMTQLESLFAQLHQQAIQLQQASACVKMLKQMVHPPHISEHETLGFQATLEELGRVLHLDEGPLSTAGIPPEMTTALSEYHQCHHLAQSQAKELELLMQLKHDFMNTVSHELRMPLTNMKMAIEMLQRLAILLKQPIADPIVHLDNQQLWQRVERYLQVLRDEWQREFQLIDDLLKFKDLEQGLDSLILAPIALDQWLPVLLHRFSEQAARHRQTLRYQIAPALPQVRSHCASLDRIFSELIDNACKHSPAGQMISILVNVQNDRLQFCVTNTGVEIAPSEQEQIFHPFYRIPRSNLWNYQGIGLGLSLVKRLLLRLEGDIQVESGAGATQFLVTLPLRV